MISKILTFFVFFSSSMGHSRWATREESSMEYLDFHRKIRVKASGQFEEQIFFHGKILNESGREQFALYRLYYNGYSQKLTIKEAYTLSDQGEKFYLTKDKIEDKPLASQGSGFDETRQITLAFPQLSVGSQVILSYVLKEDTPSVDGHFTTKGYYHDQASWQKGLLEIESEIPLWIKSFDQKKVLEITQKQEKNIYNIRMNLKKPVVNWLINESYESFLGRKKEIGIEVTSYPSWQTVSSLISSPYEEILKEKKLPQVYREVLASIKGLTQDMDIFNALIASWNDRIHYLGDWRTVKGRLEPMTLETVNKNLSGDCKDFSTGLVAMLRSLGYKAYTALVYRGIYGSLQEEIHQPDPCSFNHAIVKVIGKDQKVYWLDPTNRNTMAGLIYEDIADRPALVLSQEDSPSELEYIPDMDATKNIKSYSGVFEIENQIDAKESGRITLKGTHAQAITGLGLYLSQDQIQESFFQYVSGKPVKKSDIISFQAPSLKSRIVEDHDFSYVLKRQNLLQQSNLGKIFFIETNFTIPQIFEFQEGTVFMGVPQILEKYILIHNKKGQNLDRLNASIKTLWFDFERTVTQKSQGIQILDRLVQKKKWITAEELLSPEYKKTRLEMEEKVFGAALIF